MAFFAKFVKLFCFIWILGSHAPISLEVFSKVLTLFHFFFCLVSWTPGSHQLRLYFSKEFTLICLCFAWILEFLDSTSLDFLFSNVIKIICLCFAWILGSKHPISLGFSFFKVNGTNVSLFCLDPWIPIALFVLQSLSHCFFCFAWILGSLDPASLDYCFSKVVILSCLCFTSILDSWIPGSNQLIFLFSKVVTLYFAAGIIFLVPTLLAQFYNYLKQKDLQYLLKKIYCRDSEAFSFWNNQLFMI